MRTFGCEEELLLMSQSSGVPVAIGTTLLRVHEQRLSEAKVDAASGPSLTGELQQEMVEAVTTPHSSLDELRVELIAGRLTADAAAREHGARAVALAVSPYPVQPHPSESERYATIAEMWGRTARESLMCGLHVHVSVESPDEGAGILDRVRVWLPAVLALSANSALYDGEDTGHASYRYSRLYRWPCAGPLDLFGSAEAYHAFEAELLATGALLDQGLLTFDARLSRSYPTVEIRISDVCLLAEDSAVIAGVVRALVEIAAQEWQRGMPAPLVSTPSVRLASVMAAQSGVRGDLVDPRTGSAASAADVIKGLLDRITPALALYGDDVAISEGIARILERGNGADWQRKRLRATGRLDTVIAEAAEMTTRGIIWEA
ncbi:carboxylate-amine ligase [Lysinibacter cavernae]|uniref:Putative glutamate--cysteine ligase 2 n=1 Tax=Lysinibacter cavernae TaxID=1640652 RepID=A0A7X5QZL4_9MICO|nr:glutamate--cysteine ligase [Lysinibacter cavernae]NIH52908.1 carboxylate-amine ligase [Lysinibacter cavernae]